MTTRNGILRFATRGEFKPYYNLNYSYEVNKFGGMHKLVKSNVARNMWAIMKKFNVLPNDPLLKSLDYQAIDFIIESMNQDVREEEARANGGKVTEDSYFEDASFEDFLKDPTMDNIISNGDDPEDIYEQVKDMTEDKDYDKRLDERIDNAISEKGQIDKNVDEHIKQQQEQLEKDMQAKGINLDDIF